MEKKESDLHDHHRSGWHTMYQSRQAVPQHFNKPIPPPPREDPPTPPGYRGVDKVLNDFEGMKRFIEIKRSPYHGWNFCVGSIAEMLEDSANEIYPFIEYFGSRNTIFLVHYRNLLGKRYSFREALPDEGDMDFFRVLKALKDTGYSYGIDPDHVPRTDDDPKGYYQSYSYCFGYINAMIQAVYA